MYLKVRTVLFHVWGENMAFNGDNTGWRPEVTEVTNSRGVTFKAGDFIQRIDGSNVCYHGPLIAKIGCIGKFGHSHLIMVDEVFKSHPVTPVLTAVSREGMDSFELVPSV